MDHDRFLAASVDGYPVAFGDPGDIRLMETLRFAERDVVVVTIVRYELTKALMPVTRDRYPNLTRFVDVDTHEDKKRFEAVGTRSVVNRSATRGIDTAAALLRSRHVDESKIQAWMQRQHERALQATGSTTVSDAKSVTA